jgi:isopentenyl diphosphate isomerase/L-lactate dehydrogenase-like FMN-dependent dehydrogenase
LNIDDLKAAAKKRLPRGLFEYVERGAEDEVALANNVAAYGRLKLSPRAFVDVSSRSTETELFGRPVPMPIAIAPTGLAGLCWYDGEVLLARAARKFGLPFTLSTVSVASLEHVAEKAGGRLWFQLNLWRDRNSSYDLVARAEAAGYEALMLTVDNPASPNREYNARNGFMPFRLGPRMAFDLARHPAWLTSVVLRHVMEGGMPRHMNYPEKYKVSVIKGAGRADDLRGDDMTWDDLVELRRRWSGVLLVKGIQRAEDARRCAAEGVDGIVVSNHGGRNLDSARAPIDIVPEVVAAVGDRITVMVDGGIRRGSDITKALALGARAVLIGRATLYGISAAGQAGAERAIDLLHSELDRTMGYLGSPRIENIDPTLLTR